MASLPMHQLLVTSATGASLQLKAGQGLIEMVNLPHYGTNNGTEPAEIVVVYRGARACRSLGWSRRKALSVDGVWRR
jgi:hypothetical protein